MEKLQHKIVEVMELSKPLPPCNMCPAAEKGRALWPDPGHSRLFSRGAVCKAGGWKLRVRGKTEKKQEAEKGSFRHQELIQEFDLPEGPSPEDVTCYLDPDGKLHIQTAKHPCVEDAERELTIKGSLEERKQQMRKQQHSGQSLNTWADLHVAVVPMYIQSFHKKVLNDDCICFVYTLICSINTLTVESCFSIFFNVSVDQK